MDRCRISPARMMTEVVPSPTSSSCVRDSSIMDCTVWGGGGGTVRGEFGGVLGMDVSGMYYGCTRGVLGVRLIGDVSGLYLMGY